MFLTNDWWVWVWNHYSMSIIGFPTVIGFLLKLFAIFNPKVPTNAIMDLFKEYWPTGKPPEPPTSN